MKSLETKIRYNYLLPYLHPLSPPSLSTAHPQLSLVFGCWRGLRRVPASLFWTQQLWLNESISECSPFAQVWAASLLPPHWPHDYCHQGIHWVLMVRHTRMQRWLSLCHLGAMVGKLLNSIPTAYVYHDKPLTYGFTIVIWGEPPTHTNTDITNLSLSLSLSLQVYKNTLKQKLGPLWSWRLQFVSSWKGARHVMEYKHATRQGKLVCCHSNWDEASIRLKLHH